MKDVVKFGSQTSLGGSVDASIVALTRLFRAGFDALRGPGRLTGPSGG